MTVSEQNSAALTAALDTLAEALYAHLTAALSSTGEGDRAVQARYTALRQATERYQDLLFDELGEVLPWQLPEGAGLVESEDADAKASAVSVLVRRDYDLVDGDALLAAGRESYTELFPEQPTEAADADVTHAGRAIYQLLHAHGVDGVDRRSEQSGMAPRGGTVWVQAITDDDADTLPDDPFGIADEQMLVYRLDEIVEPDETSG